MARITVDVTRSLRGAAVPMFLALAAILLTPAAARGDDSPDYSKGFALFDKFGVPDVSTAAYVRLEYPGAWGDAVLPYDYTTSGNAWLLTETRDSRGQPARATFALPDGSVIELHWRPDKDSEDTTDDTTPANPVPPRCYGRWKPAKLDRDIKLVDSFFRNLQRDRFLVTHLGENRAGLLFLFAAQLHRRGDVKTAGRIVETLFQFRPDKKGVIRMAMNRLADGQYETLYRGFRENHDWNAYREGISELAKRYPRGWSKLPGIMELAARIDRRLADPVPVPAVTNGLTPADLTLAADLMTARNVRGAADSGRSETVWVVPESWREGPLPAGDADMAIRARGIEAIPLLMVLSEDGALTEIDARSLPGRRSSYVPDREKDPEVIFRALSRPATRGEVAVTILATLLPEDLTGPSYNRHSDVDIISAARTFHDEYRRAAAEELAVRFMPEDHGTTWRVAKAFLLKKAANQRLPVLEKHLLSDPRILRDSFGSDYIQLSTQVRGDLLAGYVMLRGEEARPLIMDFAARVAKLAADFKKPANYSFEDPKSEREYIERERRDFLAIAENLKALPLGKTHDELLIRQRDLADDHRSSYERGIVVDRLQLMKPADAVACLLQKAVETANPTGRLAMADLATYVLYLNRTFNPKDQPTPNDLKTAGWTNRWNVLITDSSEAGEKSPRRVDEVFLRLNEQLYAREPKSDPRRDSSDRFSDVGDYRMNATGRRAAGIIQAHGALGREFVRQRVVARLAGVPEDKLPAYPGEVPLPENRRAVLKIQLAAVTSREQAAQLIGTLPLDEQGAVPDLLREDPELNRRLLALANAIVEVKVEDPVLLDKFAAWQGREPSPALLRELREHCQTMAKAGQAATFLLARAENFGGCRITMRRSAQLQQDRGSDGNDKKKESDIEGLSGLVCVPGVYGSARWRTAPAPAKPDWRTMRTSNKDSLDVFERAMDDFCGTNAPASAAGVVKFQTQRGAQ
jgi:hypothetical protein